MKLDWKKFVRDRRVMSPTWYSRDWGVFAYSFKNAADLVYANYKKTRRDAFWFPAIYLYRQWVELSLKSLWYEVSKFDSSVGSVPRTHQLLTLWAPIRKWFNEAGLIAADDDFIPSTERFFSVLDEIDPQGTAFRYPPNEVPHRDIVNFSLDDFETAVEHVDTMLFGLTRLLDEYEEFLVSTLPQP
jgi:hypothetical protein